ncbi:Phospholipase-like protein [Corchorus capsularis]|uniref:Phospholipase-like protein n=1 Tax=Corchorus capsularis TaxID=210143 RepID=A0A1R3HXP6_COCAP|nr:Phospholipase-like protein [Corchorus capsularis]
MEEMPANLNESVALPSDCFVPKVARKCASSSVPCRRSERIFLMEANKSLESLKCTNALVPAMDMKMTCIQYPHRHSGTSVKCSMGATLSLDGNNNIASSSDNHKEKRKRGRPTKLRPQEGGDSNRQRTCVINSLVISRGETSENPAVTKGPIICPVWRGSFRTEKFGLLVDLAAYASMNASEEVFNLASHLPAQLDLEVLPVLDVCPEFFSIPTPNIGLVDLKIFPENERSEGDFNDFMKHLFNEQLAMKTMVNDTVLLIFTSHLLPYEYWRTYGKYYLWGVFSGKNAFFPGSEEANVLPTVDTALPRITATAEEKQMGKKMMESMSNELPMLELKSCNNTLCNNTSDSDSGKGDNGVSNAENDAAKSNTEEHLMSTAAGKAITNNSCLPLVLGKYSPQQRTEEGRKEEGAEIQLQLTLGSQEGDDAHEGMDDIMKVSASQGVASATIGASVFHMFHNFDDMDLEGISSADPSGMRARQYAVKASLVPTLNAIIEKHGDIAQDCPLTSGETLTNILERVCQAVEDLGALPFSKLHISVLKSIYSTISDAELLKLNVKWLRDRCDELLETVSGIRKYKSLKSDIKEHTTSIKYKRTAIDLKRTEMMKLQSEIQSLENEVASMTEKTGELEKTRSSVKSKYSYFRHNSLVNGLL